jgi:folate-binding protein YgfZ
MSQGITRQTEFDIREYPDDYGDFASEAAALHRGVGVLNFSSAGKLEVSGKNSLQFINGLVTNEVKSLAPGAGTVGAFLNAQGKVLALCRFYQTGTRLLIELDASNRAKIFQNLSRFVPAGEFFVSDVSDEFALISLQGPRAGDLLARLTDGWSPGDAPYSYGQTTIGGTTVEVAAHARCGPIGYDLFVAPGEAPALYQHLVCQGEEFGARPAGKRAFETARIEAGIATEPDDINENYILLETGRDDAVSYTKGCYLGQEIIARIHWRGQPAKRLMGLRVDAELAPAKGTHLIADDGKKIGEVTSSAWSERFFSFIALAYVHRYYLTPGTRVTLQAGDQPVGRAEVTSLPFGEKSHE